MPEEVSVKAKTGLAFKLKDYNQLLKPSLSLMVVFSSIIGYLLAPNAVANWQNIMVLLVGGMLVTGSANTINQIIEIDTDRLMNRTRLRPLPDGRMGVQEAWIFAIICGVAGVLLLGKFFNVFCAVLSAISLVLYAFAYTPMKRINPIAVLIGAIPGALPPLIGWSAAANSLSLAAWLLFIIQFFWQFPHLWAIAWVAFEDYKKAGIRMLPSNAGKTRFTGLQCMLYSLVLIPLALVARAVHLTGNMGMVIAMVAAVLYLAASFIFYKKNDQASAKRLMYTSFLYLPMVLLGFLFDKI